MLQPLDEVIIVDSSGYYVGCFKTKESLGIKGVSLCPYWDIGTIVTIIGIGNKLPDFDKPQEYQKKMLPNYDFRKEFEEIVVALKDSSGHEGLYDISSIKKYSTEQKNNNVTQLSLF